MEISGLLWQPHERQPGGAAGYLEGFAAAMASAGHARGTISGYLDWAIHCGGWVEANGLDLADINDQTIHAFGAHRCPGPGRRRQKRVSHGYLKRVQRFVDHLRPQGAIAQPARPPIETSSPLTAFRDWLLRHPGLAIPTTQRHQRLVSRMLPALGTDPGEYHAAWVRGVMLDQIRGGRPAHAKTIVGARRVYWRFLATHSACPPGLDHALPTLAEGRLSWLPRYLAAG